MCQWVNNFGRGEHLQTLKHTQMSQKLWFLRYGPDLFHASKASLSLLIGWLKQVSARTGVGSLTLPRLERNWLTRAWVWSPRRTLCKTIQGRMALDLIINLHKRVRSGIDRCQCFTNDLELSFNMLILSSIIFHSTTWFPWHAKVLVFIILTERCKYEHFRVVVKIRGTGVWNNLKIFNWLHRFH